MRILVTGGAGYIGSHTCVELLQAGHDAVILDNLYNSKASVVGRIAALGGKAPVFYEGDMRNRALLDKIFAAHEIDAVIHFAGLKAVPESVRKPLDYYGVNIGGTVTLLEAMRAAGCRTLVFSSSATVYGSENIAPFREDMPVGKATNPYGSTKIIIEQILGDLCRSEEGWSFSLLRYFNPVGAHPSGTLGEDPNGTPYNVMPILCGAALGKQDVFLITGADFDTPDGTCIRDYIHVVDLARGHLKALDKLLRTPGCAVYNLGTGKGLSVRGLVAAFERASGLKLPVKVAPRRPGDIAVCYADASKAGRELGWRAERTPDDMCRDVWKYLQSK